MIYFFSVALSALGAGMVARFGSRLGLLDTPSGRSSHSTPIPKGGGLGILAAFICSSYYLDIPVPFWLPISLISIISFFADKMELSPKIRLILQFIVTLILIFGVQSGSDYQIAVLLWSIYIVGTANFYNFMDGIDGIAGITGFICFGFIAVYSILFAEGEYYTTLAVVLSISCLAFLPFNFPHAKVFMGDSGSILLGFSFGSLVFLMSESVLDFICLSAFLFPFFADELITKAYQIKNGESLIKPHRKHLYQLLANEKGIAHWIISVSYGLIQLVVGTCVMILRSFGVIPISMLLTVFFFGFVWIYLYTRKSIANSE